MADTDAHWKKWGEQDPYFGVLSHSDFRGASLDGSVRKAFFLTGENEITERLDFFGRHYGEIPRGTAVDFGCGVGRLMLPLGRRYEKVVGIDVSPAMIREAEKNCSEAGLSCVFCQSVSDLKSNSVDLVHSSHVLQHIAAERGLAIISKLLDALVIGGVAALHITAFRRLSTIKEIVYRVKHGVPGAYYVLNLIQGKKITEPLMLMTSYPLYKVLDVYRQKGMDDILLQPVFDSSYGFVVTGRRVR